MYPTETYQRPPRWTATTYWSCEARSSSPNWRVPLLGPFDDPHAFFRDVQQFAQRFVDSMHAVSADTYIAFDHKSTLPYLDTHDHSDIARLGHICNCGTDIGKVSYGTEASLFFNANVPTVICGPGHIDQAHQPNEWCEVSQLARCESFMQRLADQVCIDA